MGDLRLTVSELPRSPKSALGTQRAQCAGSTRTASWTTNRVASGLGLASCPCRVAATINIIMTRYHEVPVPRNNMRFPQAPPYYIVHSLAAKAPLKTGCMLPPNQGCYACASAHGDSHLTLPIGRLTFLPLLTQSSLRLARHCQPDAFKRHSGILLELQEPLKHAKADVSPAKQSNKHSFVHWLQF